VVVSEWSGDRALLSLPRPPARVGRVGVGVALAGVGRAGGIGPRRGARRRTGRAGARWARGRRVGWSRRAAEYSESGGGRGDRPG
jgi:hypothetical protein